jgi:SagB-type dehydrogenase family enzyme
VFAIQNQKDLRLRLGAFSGRSLFVRLKLHEEFTAKLQQQTGGSINLSETHRPAMTWREYHEATKHSVESLKRARLVLDWANMPDPFRYYEGVPVLDLPADPPASEIPALDVMKGAFGRTSTTDGQAFLSQLLFYSAAISASKRVPSTGYEYALRVNPSSGNLHPTEFHFITRGLKDWPDGLYHYDPSRHMAEQRARGAFDLKMAGGPAPIVFVLTSIVWREAWKYGERAYRYCLHDIGHAWQALALSARAIGCDAFAAGNFVDDEVVQLCRPNLDEWPMLLVGLRGESIPLRAADTGETVWFVGQANLLSKETIAQPLIDGIHFATKQDSSKSSSAAFAESAAIGSGEIAIPPPASSSRSFGEVARMRRSALDFVGGQQSMSAAELSAILACTAQPLSGDFTGARFIQLYLYAHRVDGLQRGVYRFWPDRAELEQVKSGDQRVAAAALSLGQNLAGNSCVTFSMIGDLDRATGIFRDRGYRYVHFEAGAIGQLMYVAAEALGLGATGIGAFYDDEVHRHLNLTPQQGQVVYHFAIGYPVPDPRISAAR